jgi:Asparagine synthase
MYTFLVAAGIGRDVGPTLDRAQRITDALMPRMGASVTSHRAFFPTIDGGWFYFLPAPTSPRPLVTEHRDDRQAVLVYGNVDDCDGLASPAEQVATTWQAQGLEAVRRLNGSFSAVLIDLTSASLFVVSDAICRRALRYFCHQDLLLISNHDVPIIATGLCELNFDLVSAASIVSCGWSIRGASLAQNLQICDAHSYVRRHAGRTERVRQPVLSLRERLEPGDTRARSQLTEEMVETLRRTVRRQCEAQKEVQTSLTAGLDSRAVFGLLVSILEPARIVAQTFGSPDEFDVSAARRIASAYGARHKLSAPEAPSSDAFLTNTDALAFFRDGDVCSKRAMWPLIRYDHDAPVGFGGQGGEIVRGYFYSEDFLGVRGMALHEDDVAPLLESKMLNRMRRAPWNDQSLADAFLSRFRQSLQGFQDISRNVYDVLDMYYLYERSARWISTASMPQLERHCAPFESSALAAMAYRLPAPIGHYCRLHETIIRRWLPRAYWWRMTDDKILPLDGVPGMRKLLRWRRIIGRRMGRLRGNVRTDFDVMRAELLAGPLGEVMVDTLTAQDSIASAIFSREGLSKMIEAHRTGVKFELEVLGGLLTVERWRQQVTDARNRAVTAAREQEPS